MKKSIFSLLATTFCCSFALADTLFVPSTMPIGTAIASSVDGDWIVLEPGVHEGPIIAYGRELTIGSRYLLDGDTAWIAETVVQAPENSMDSSSCAIYASSEPQGRLKGLTLRGGTGTSSSLSDHPVGGCVYVDRANPSIERCRLTGGDAYSGGAVFVSGQQWVRNAHIRISDCVIDSCHADGWGGGINAFHCTLSVRNTTFRALTCDLATAALSTLTSFVSLDSLTITGCFGGDGGIGITEGWGTIAGCDFFANASPWSGFSSQLALHSFFGTVSGCRFRDTEAPWPSVFIGGSPGQTYFVGNVLENNTTTDVTSTLFVGDRNDNVVSHNVFRNNVNIQGGAVLAFQDADAYVEHNTFIGNSSTTTGQGSVLRSNTRGRPRFANNIIAGNIGNCVSARPEYPIILDARNNWWGHASGPYHAELNPLGQGDTLVGDSVLFEPWLTSPPDTTQPSAIHPEPEWPVAGTWDLQSVFPNPFNNSFRLSLAGFAGRAFEIAMYDILGRRVATLHSGPALGGLFTFPVSPELSSGIYFVAAHDDIVRESIKVVLLK
ncbi:MAG: hypothetical protein IPG71_02985 [bacterium]|nr:hypothetical protein [bacterium]